LPRRRHRPRPVDRLDQSASCAGVSTSAPSTIGGQTNLPRSSRFASTRARIANAPRSSRRCRELQADADRQAYVQQPHGPRGRGLSSSTWLSMVPSFCCASVLTRASTPLFSYDSKMGGGRSGVPPLRTRFPNSPLPLAAAQPRKNLSTNKRIIPAPSRSELAAIRSSKRGEASSFQQNGFASLFA
jgi:hypothetical protein